jgi:nucleoside-diphosphate-sugar epimerase
MKTVLVTGATGFIGRHALNPLAARGFEVHAVSSRPALSNGSSVRWHVADLFDAAGVRSLVETVRPSHLLHFAWAMVPGGEATPVDNLRWVETTLGLVRAFAVAGGARAVVTGSCAEYDWRYGYCVEHLTPLAPRSYYGVCKNAARLACEGYFDELRLSFSWPRIFFVYGPHEPLPRFVPSLLSSLGSRNPARCTHGEQCRDYLHVEDAAEACVAVLDSDVRGPINIASGRPTRLRDMAEYIARRFEAEDLLRMGALPVALNDPPMVVGDVRRLTTDLGWRPRHNMQTGLDHTIAWWTQLRAQAVECIS